MTTLVQQAAVVGLHTALAGVGATCLTPLLSDPLTARRMGALHRLLDGTDMLAAIVPTSVGSGGGISSSAADAAARQQCAALALMHALAIGVLLPTALAWRAAPLPPAHPTAQPAARHGGSSGDGPWAAVGRDLRSSALALSLLAWLLLSNVWLVCKALVSCPGWWPDQLMSGVHPIV